MTTYLLTWGSMQMKAVSLQQIAESCYAAVRVILRVCLAHSTLEYTLAIIIKPQDTKTRLYFAKDLMNY